MKTLFEYLQLLGSIVGAIIVFGFLIGLMFIDWIKKYDRK